MVHDVIYRHYRLFGRIERNENNRPPLAMIALKILVLTLFGCTLPIVYTHSHGSPFEYGVGTFLLWSLNELINWHFDIPIFQGRLMLIMMIAGLLITIEMLL